MCGGGFLEDIWDGATDIVDDVVGGLGDAVGGIADGVGDLATSAFDYAGNIIEGIGDDPLKAAASFALSQFGLPALGFEGINIGGELMSSLDMASDFATGGDLFGLSDAVGQGSGLDILADTVTGAGPAGDWGGIPEWLDISEPWRTVGSGMPPTGGLEDYLKMPEWTQSPQGVAGKVGGEVISNKIGDYIKNQKMGDLANVIAGMQSKNTQSDVGTGTRQAIDDMYARINGLYAEGSPELAQMRKTMERRDAAAGRRSQYGPREVELAGNIAKYKADAIQRVGLGSLPQYVQSLNTSANRNSGLYSAFSKLMGDTTLGDVINGISGGVYGR